MSDYIYIKSYLITSSIIIRYSLSTLLARADGEEWRIVNFPLELCVHAFISFENHNLEVLLMSDKTRIKSRSTDTSNIHLDKSASRIERIFVT